MSVRSLLIWGVIALVLTVGFAAFQGPSAERSASEVSYSAFLDSIERGEVVSVTSAQDTMTFRDQAGRDFVTFLPAGAMPDTLRALRNAKVEIRAARGRQGPTLADILMGMLPMLLLIGAWFFFMRQMQKKPPDSLS